MSNEASPAPSLDLRAWLAELAKVPEVGGATVSRDEQRALLDLTRVAAHRSDRIAAPITAYVVGLALAARPSDERARALGAIVAALEEGAGS
ncbi:MAG: DUF6457 domain-containing protein [Candidatus Limnocylindrales bacterium]